ncbi:MAG TPA: hypothetical protein ENI34_03930 [candidate division WOR-3 bacterium]|uniref:Uncharacterized protein n=1 Tax=candidate division WOR-3 bacterium TaxID=2052148 RepID=A0A9C9EMV3_UNCW3|nr:hypothetical protein [candidate division WOR-3 bacterium]
MKIKYPIALFLIVFLFLSMSCSKSKTVTLNLSNNQNIAVAYAGYYSLNDGAEESISGTTPNEYEFVLEKGDKLAGLIYKSDSSNVTDTLVFKVYVDDVEQTDLTRNIVIPTEIGGVQFQITVQ